MREAITIEKRRAVPAFWRVMIKDRQGYACASCPTNFWEGPSPIEYDHIIPIALGGAHVVGNLQALCPKCHLEKTKADVKAIAKAKRIARRETDGAKPSRMRSRGFDKTKTRGFDGAVRPR